MKNFLIRRLLFHIFVDSASVSKATGWSEKQLGDLSDQSGATSRDLAIKNNSARLSEIIGVIHSTIDVLAELTDISLQAKLNEIELRPDSSKERLLGHLPIAIDESDFANFARLFHWTIDQTACLSIGLSPTSSTLRVLESVQPSNARQQTYFQEFHQRRLFLGQALEARHLAEKSNPNDALKLLKEMNKKLPRDLLDFVERVNRKRFGDGQATPNTEKLDALDPRVRTTLLKMIVGMAVEQYSFDPTADRSDAVKNILQDLDHSGIHLDPKTIRHWLKEASKHLPKQYKNR